VPAGRAIRAGLAAHHDVAAAVDVFELDRVSARLASHTNQEVIRDQLLVESSPIGDAIGHPWRFVGSLAELAGLACHASLRGTSVIEWST
jgi:hypothetical protein